MNAKQLRYLGMLLRNLADAEHSACMLDPAWQQKIAELLTQVKDKAVWHLQEEGLLLGAEIVEADGAVIGVVKEIAIDPYGSGDWYVYYDTPEGSRDCMAIGDINEDPSYYWRLPGGREAFDWALAELVKWHGESQGKTAPNEIALPA
jgi:hypothetical protein